MYVLNIEDFGYTIKVQEYDDMAHAVRHFITFKLKTLVNHPPVLTSQYLNSTAPNDTGGVDEVRREPRLLCEATPTILLHLLHSTLALLISHTYNLLSHTHNMKHNMIIMSLLQIFMISLERRLDRRNRMLACLNAIQLNFTLFDAVDGRYMHVCIAIWIAGSHGYHSDVLDGS